MSHGALPAVIAGACVFGMLGSLWTSIRKPLADRFGNDESQWAGIGTAFAIALGPLMLLAGLIVDTTSARWVLIGSSLLLGTALFGLALSRGYAQSLAAVIAAAAGTAATGVAAISLMPAAFLDHSAAASLNLGFIFVTLGALVTPPASSLLVHALGYQRGLGIIAVLTLIPAGLGLLVSGSEFGSANMDSVESHQSLAAPVIWLASAVLMLYIVVEGMIITWLVEHSAEFDATRLHDGWSPWGFWIAFLVSRVVLAFALETWLPAHSDTWVLFVVVVLVTVTLGNMVGSQNRLNIRWGVWALGAFLGPVLPTLIGLLFREYGASHRGTALGIVFAIGTAVSLAVTPLAVSYSKGKSARVALRPPLVAALIFTAVTLVFTLTLSALLF